MHRQLNVETGGGHFEHECGVLPRYGVKRPFARVCGKSSCKLNNTIGCLLWV